MNALRWTEKLRRIGTRNPVETDLSVFEDELSAICSAGDLLRRATRDSLEERAVRIRERALRGESPDNLIVDSFALTREIAARALGMRPFDVQVLAGIALHRNKLVEMKTGEGKTLAAVLPAALNALAGNGVHVLTFNDYLARRDASWMGPVYEFLGLRVGTVQEGLAARDRREAYAADVTYATAKEAGFDFLRANLCRSPADIVQRPFHLAIVDEADSILIDEARVPLVIAGEIESSATSPYRIAEVVRGLTENRHWEASEYGHNVELTETGLEAVERELGAGDLHAPENYLVLTEVNQALHAAVLLDRDVDYIVRDNRVELVDEFTGRVVDDRRWPDGLQAALEAKEALPIRPGGRILGSITLQHFLAQYPRLAGLTATAQSAAEELYEFYGLRVVPVPPNRPCIREDLSDLVFTHDEARTAALVGEIVRQHDRGRPVLVGTRSVAESERIATRVGAVGLECRVLNAKNDEEEAAIIAEAGAPGAVTISTNMAGRGTDIRLGGADEGRRDDVVGAGGLLVIGTARHESRRIDDQLRGRAGRQGDPGSSRFFVSLDDDLLVRYGLDELIPVALRPPESPEPVNHPIVLRELDRLQRIAEGKNFEIRRTLWRYSSLVEEQRKKIHAWRAEVLRDEWESDIWARREPELFRWATGRFGARAVSVAERGAIVHFIDECWADQLAYVSHLREGIHLVGIGGLDPLYEFHRQIAESFWKIQDCVESRTARVLADLRSRDRPDIDDLGLQAPSSTWTYLVSDQVLTELQQMLFGRGSVAFSAAAVLMTWPVLGAWAIWTRIRRRSRKGEDGIGPSGR